MLPQVLLLGATGFTGQLVAQELLKQNISFYFSGTNTEKLVLYSKEWQMPFMQINLLDRNDFAKIPQDIKFILNCAGPFGLFAPLLLDFLFTKQVVYLDVSGEESFVFNSYRDHSKTKATLVHACAFESFIADALVSRLPDPKDGFNELFSFYHFANPKVSPGTRLSMQLVRHFQTHAFENSKWVARAPGETNIEVNFEGVDPKICRAIFAPYPEILFFAKAHKSLNASSFILAKESDWTQFINESRAPKPIDEILSKHRSLARPGPSEEERKKGRFMVAVRGISHEKIESRACVFGVDSYKITATIMVQSLVHLMQKESVPSGVFAPSELVDSYAILDSLKEEFELAFLEPA